MGSVEEVKERKAKHGARPLERGQGAEGGVKCEWTGGRSVLARNL